MVKDFPQKLRENWLACVVAVVVVVVVAVAVSFQYRNSEQYIIGEVVSISSGTATLDNFDTEDGAYTGESSRLYIIFESDGCVFYDENGEECEALDIAVGSKVKMTASTKLVTDENGYTTVYIKKVEVLSTD